MLIKMRKSQSVTEYAILLSVAIAAFAGMQVYVKRGLQARLKSGTDAATGAAAGKTITVDGGTTTGDYSVQYKNIGQYEPYYLEQKGESYQESVKQEHMGGGEIAKEIVSDVSASAAGGYRAEVALNATARKTREEDVWGSGN